MPRRTPRAKRSSDGEMTTFKDLHRPGDPLLLPNAWDAVTGAALAAAGFPAIGTTSLGVAAAAGKPDAAGDAWRRPALAHRLAHLDCHVTVDFEHGFSDDPDEVAEHAAQLGPVAGINLEDRHGDPALHARKIAAVKARTPGAVRQRPHRHPLAARRRPRATPIERCPATSRPAPTACSSPACPIERHRSVRRRGRRPAERPVHPAARRSPNWPSEASPASAPAPTCSAPRCRPPSNARRGRSAAASRTTSASYRRYAAVDGLASRGLLSEPGELA